MIRPTSLLSRSVAIVCTTLLVNLAFPMGLPKLLADHWPANTNSKSLIANSRFVTRAMTGKEMKAVQGRITKNPYVAGSQKWSVSYKGVDLITGNFATSATDMTFEGGYGIPINVTRSYSSNSADEGPLGVGWSLSVDVRSTAGGILKSSGAPVRNVPLNIKERPSNQLDDPRADTSGGGIIVGSSTQPAEAVIATDAAGTDETIQRDVDGVLTTPPWDKNTSDCTYEWVTNGAGTYQVLVSNKVTTPDGTVYEYAKEGWYDSSGTSTIDGSALGEPSNILKVTSVTDRQGNVTHYTYDNTSGHEVSFQKINGVTLECPLTQIDMPNGHIIDFHWGTGGSGSYPGATNRIMAISDNGAARTVAYTYSGTDNNLASVTTPAGLTTSYGYGGATTDGNFSVAGVGDLLQTITDPRGLVTTIGYTVDNSLVIPYLVSMPAVRAYKLTTPNGVTTYYFNAGTPVPSDSIWYSNIGSFEPSGGYADVAYGASVPFQIAAIKIAGAGSAPVVGVQMSGVGGWDFNGTNLSAYTWSKQYDTRTEDLIEEVHFDGPMKGAFLSNRDMLFLDPPTKTIQDTSYNFMGNPLSKTTYEQVGSGTTGSITYSNTRVQTTDFAYWGADKYFQQKATRIPTGSGTYRYSMTDYFQSTAAAGRRGQTYKVWSPAFAPFLDTTDGSTPPGDSADYWKYWLRVDISGAYHYAAGFDYDSVGRPTDVYKIKAVSGGSATYVQTHTTYNDASGHWGQAETVVEDYGSGKINRTTTTNGYTSWGQADDVTDAAGHRFYTDYDGDGKVNSVTRTDVTPNVTVVSYTYGTGKVTDTPTPTATNGQVTTLTDELSGVTQSFEYNTGLDTSPGAANYIGGAGQVKSISENDSSLSAGSYSTSYIYNESGDRQTATYVTANGTTKWGYDDYVPAGDPASPSRVFQTLRKLDSTTGYPTSEEMQYAYMGSGALKTASFAMTPASGFTPSTGNPYYDSSHLPASRARAYYLYDGGGRITQLNHYWDVWGGSAYGTPDALISNTCNYEISTGTSNVNRGLKTVSDFYVQNSGTHTAFSLDHEDQYGYDANLDYLTSASYNGGSSTTSWSYDAAGNRNDASTVDNLNRATTISSVSRTYDILGNTTAIGGTKSMSWDVVNRMLSYTVSSATTNYAYRGDGMRVTKSNSSVADIWAYDGQMQMEESETASSALTVTRYGLGARGIDYIGKTTSSGTTVGFPIYDAHGNMVATIGRTGTNAYTVGNIRWFEAWGGILSGSSTGDPKNRYCARVGHVQDDESGLIYMRARSYDPASGRFLSSDVQRDGTNWFGYCRNDPVNLLDETGKMAQLDPVIIVLMFIGYLLSTVVSLAIKYLLPSGIAFGLICLSIEATAGLPLVEKAALGFGFGMLSQVWLSSACNNIGKALNEFAQAGGIEAGEAQWSFMAKCAATVAAYYMTIRALELFVDIGL